MFIFYRFLFLVDFILQVGLTAQHMDKN